MASPMRSFTEPPGLKNSAFAYTGVRTPRVTLFRRMSGVQPMVSRTFAYGLVFGGTRIRARLGGVGGGMGRIDSYGTKPRRVCLRGVRLGPDNRRSGGPWPRLCRRG